MEPKIAYLLGALRDGNVDIRKGKNYEIKIGQKNQKWLELILKPIIEKHFNTRVSVKDNLLRLTRKKAVMKIKKLSGITSPQENWQTPELIKRLPIEERIPYIRGFWDAEGGLPKHPEIVKKAEQRYISFHQKTIEPLQFIRNTLILLNFKPTKITKCSNAFEFRITRKSYIKKFFILIGSWHPEKGKRLKLLTKN